MTKGICWLILMISLIRFNVSASVNDSLPKDTLKEVAKDITLNIDSLSGIWYVKSKLPKDFNKLIEGRGQIINTKLSDKDFGRKIASLKLTFKISANEKIKQFVERYLFAKRLQTELMIGIMKSYNGVIEKIIKANALPDELKYLPMAESSLFNNAKSESGGAGLWQLSYANAKRYGLEESSFIDERKDIRKSTIASVKALKDFYSIYNDWLLAITAFNSSPEVVNKAIRRANGKIDFWSIYKYLPQQSRDYVPAFIASVYVMNYYKDYQLKPIEIIMPEKADSVKILKLLHLKQVSAVLQLPIQQLKELNPQYKRAIIPERPEGYFLALPVGYGGRFFLHKDSIYNYKDSSFRSELKLPLTNNNIGLETINSTAEIYYIVKPNDNIGRIANKYKVTVSEIVKWNKLKSKTIKKGQKLRIYFNTGRNENASKENKPGSANSKLQTLSPANDSIVKKRKYDSLILRAELVLYKKKYNEAIELYQKAGSIYPAIDLPKNRISQIKEILRKDEIDKAVEKAKKLKKDSLHKPPVINKNMNKPKPPKDTVINSKPAAKDSGTSTEKTINDQQIYIVKPGDVLSRIANSHGMKLKDLLEINSIDADHKIKPGDKLKLNK